MKSGKQQKRKYILQLAGLLLLLVVANIAASYVHTRLDLTADKRFTLSPSTKKLLGNLQGPVKIDVYLKGDFPAGFRHLQESVKDLLQEFQEYGGANVQYDFVQPGAGLSDSSKEKFFDKLAAEGIKPFNLQVQTEASQGYSQKLIFPGAVVQYNGKEKGVTLLQNQGGGGDAMQALNNSTALLEFQFANAIHQLESGKPPLVGYLLGNGEALGPNVYDALHTLQSNYRLDTLNLATAPFIPPDFDAMIIEQPQSRFSEQEKLKLDQYVMHGGKLLWFIDQVNADMDSLQQKDDFIAYDKGLNLEDILFTYGVRINPDLIEDLQCDVIPLTVGSIGNKPQIQLVPWPYFSIFTPTSDHPIVKNLDGVMGMFVNSMDTVNGGPVKKTVLLSSSEYSRILGTPAKVSWESVKVKPDPRDYPKQNIPAAVLLEGKFPSLFQNRLDKSMVDSINNSFPEPFANQGVNNKMIVVADGDIITNAVSKKDGPLPMGMNLYTRYQFANKEFFLNCLEYLTDSSGIMETRTKDVKLRLLDDNRVKAHKLKWQIINLLAPLILLLIFALVFNFIRQRKYAE